MPYMPPTRFGTTESEDELENERLRKLGPRGQLMHRCAECSTSAGQLLVCTGCKAVRYCSKEHQVQHRADHKAICSKIKKSRNKLNKEENLVRNATPDFMTPANAFETSVGHFWGILSTRDYMRARFALTVQLRETATLDSIAEMVDHCRDMLRLCRNDNMGIRDVLPCLLLQLDRDQECHDFVKWWMVESQVEEDWREDGKSYLSTHDADAYEDVTCFDKNFWI